LPFAALKRSRSYYMIYKIIIEKSGNGRYSAYSPVAENLVATGATITSALENLRLKMICYLHDPQAELDIMIECPEPGGIVDLSESIMRPLK
jgi:hypothetical protein